MTITPARPLRAPGASAASSGQRRPRCRDAAVRSRSWLLSWRTGRGRQPTARWRGELLRAARRAQSPAVTPTA
eukprot:15450568-Alexandrium_andersonii.AAC.1